MNEVLEVVGSPTLVNLHGPESGKRGRLSCGLFVDTEALVQEVVDLIHSPMFCHSGLRPGNIMKTDGRIATMIDSERAGVARRQMDQGLNLEKILTYAIDGCLSACKMFGKYYWLADLTGSCDMPETC